jgi:hypothetical protein
VRTWGSLRSSQAGPLGPPPAPRRRSRSRVRAAPPAACGPGGPAGLQRGALIAMRPCGYRGSPEPPTRAALGGVAKTETGVHQHAGAAAPESALAAQAGNGAVAAMCRIRRGNGCL